MKKGYIVTWFNSGRNYGQTLQAFALQKKIEQLDAEALLLNFGSNLSAPCGFVNYLKKRIKIRGNKWKIQKKFDTFVKNNMKVTRYFKDYNMLCSYVNNSDCDFLICGSDQIWNPYNIEPIYYLHGLGTEKTKKISYAASLCDLKRKNKFDDYPEVKDWIRSLDQIYVRENTGKVIIQEKFGCNATVVLDPTLLFHGNEWVEMLRLKTNIQRKYILCYAFNLSPEQIENIEQRAKKLGCAIYYGNILMQQKAGMNIENWSPIDFLESIYNAQEIITDSFHGTVFSILFHKKFFVIDNGKDEESDPYYNFDRIETLLQALNLESRIVDDQMKGFDTLEPDYTSVDIILDKMRNESTKHLKGIVSV